jgi:hypothetical protein
MSATRRPRFSVSRLDDRITPAVTVRPAAAGMISVTGYPNSSPLLFPQTAPNVLTISDGPNVLGSFNAPGGLNATLSRFNQAVLFDANGMTFAGPVTLDLGLGSVATGIREVSVYDGAGGGAIAGNLNVRNGSGSEYISVGRPSATVATSIPMQVNGSVFVSTRYSAGPDTFELVPGSHINGGLYLTNLDNVSVGVYEPGGPVLAGVDGSVSVSTPTPRGPFTVDVYATLGSTLSVTSSAGSLQPSVLTLHDGTTVGNVTAVLSNGGNLVTLGTQVAGEPAPVTGAVSITTGTGSDQVQVLDDPLDVDNVLVQGNLTVNTGAGNNTVLADSAMLVMGSANVTGSNGNNTVSGTSGFFRGTVNGPFAVTFGSGANTINFGATVGGSTVKLKTGDGADTVTIGAMASAPASALQVWLGGGNDRLDLFSNDFFSGLLDGGLGAGDDLNAFAPIPVGWTVTGFEV